MIRGFTVGRIAEKGFIEEVELLQGLIEWQEFGKAPRSIFLLLITNPACLSTFIPKSKMLINVRSENSQNHALVTTELQPLAVGSFDCL